MAPTPRVQHLHFTYRTTCLVTGKWYVGMHSTANINDGYLGSGKILLRSVKKYGAGGGATLTREQILRAATAGGQALKAKKLADPNFASKISQRMSEARLGKSLTTEHRDALRGPRGKNPIMSARLSKACTVDGGITVYSSRKALIDALGQGTAGKRSPHFKYIT